ncbi:MAG: hypothetical protein M9887_00460 [Chitinophagales bacterium]|nr:hypothetical protein [Chitinophagales bacterium]
MNENKRVVILSSIRSERLIFVLDTIFGQRLKVNYILSNQSNVIQGNDIVIEYNFTPSTSYPFIKAEEIIVEKNIHPDFKPAIANHEENLLIFPSVESFLGFDIFSAVFYCLSHYDAYTQTKFDEHKRVKFAEWFPRVSGLDRFPYIEIWIQKLKVFIEEQQLECISPTFKQDISFDIDHFYLISQRPLIHHIKATIKDIYYLRFFNLFKRWMIIFGLAEDPGERFFDILDYQNNEKFSFFILMKQGGKDSLNVLNEVKRKLIRKLENIGEIAIHPSYHSSQKPELISKEKKQLEEIIQDKVSVSRFHYLKFQFPNSFYHLVENGISIDKSIGYYDRCGFPSSTSLPYDFFDPVANKKLELQIHPFVWMDSQNKYYRQIDEKEEKQELIELKSLVKRYDGHFNVVFHNDSMIDSRYRLLFKFLLYG